MTATIYLAGPEVFLTDGRAIMAEKAAMVRAAGFRPLSPGDLAIPPEKTGFERGLAISAVDEAMMLQADAIIANLTPFRGPSADPGTVFELGFMCAREKQIFAYTNVAADNAARLDAFYEGAIGRDSAGHLRGPDGLSIEDFSMIDNLMLHGGIVRRGGLIVTGNAPEQTRFADLAAFAECLAQATPLLRGLA